MTKPKVAASNRPFDPDHVLYVCQSPSVRYCKLDADASSGSIDQRSTGLPPIVVGSVTALPEPMRNLMPDLPTILTLRVVSPERSTRIVPDRVACVVPG